VLFPASSSLAVSRPKADIVVKPPKTPVPNNKTESSCNDKAKTAPNRKAPERFTIRVGQGNSVSLPDGRNSVIAHLAIDPAAPPKPTIKAGCMVRPRIDGASYF